VVRMPSLVVRLMTGFLQVGLRGFLRFDSHSQSRVRWLGGAAVSTAPGEVSTEGLKPVKVCVATCRAACMRVIRGFDLVRDVSARVSRSSTNRE
jgi:hypothetical protein